MRFFKRTLLATTFLITSTTLSHADIKVVASIKPIHSLVSAVAQGIGEPILLVKGAGSPHTYSLKPSQAKELQQADIVFWMGRDLEAFLENSIDNIATNSIVVPLMESNELAKLNFREGGAFEDHGHDDHGHDKHDDNKDHDEHDDHGHDKHDDHKDHDEHDDHGHDKHDDHKDHDEHDEHGHDKHDDHKDHDEHDDHGADPHVWLDPINAIVLVEEIKKALISADPKNKPTYEANAKSTIYNLNELIEEIDAELKPVKGRGYIVFHDAYQYFENRFGVSAVGSIIVSPEVLPGAERIRELQNKVKELDATCVFSEPQFKPKLVTTVTENTNAGTGVLDPLGASINDGPQLYFTLIRNMASSLKKCLMQAG
ncbi:MAG: zinc ABC transporter substrate-binding protein [Alphaproteobacteria bacterium]|nr:zinc ABC transporter substrate-binding protein [Alphaproteobacteria bacterium]